MIKIDFYHIFWFLSYCRNMLKKKPMVQPHELRTSTKKQAKQTKKSKQASERAKKQASEQVHNQPSKQPTK